MLFRYSLIEAGLTSSVGILINLAKSGKARLILGLHFSKILIFKWDNRIRIKESVEEREFPNTLGLKEMAIGKNFASFVQQFFMRGAHTYSAKY